ncbi:MAG: HTH domain-containing protein [Magnetospirillum sp.]|nr:HTH domain-containing protein [Magnetospirillum sp.]
MSRAERLLQLLQIPRRHRYPVSGGALAAELGVSLRTLYRDIRALQAQGAGIDGEPGLGYVLRPGFLLPPLMFSDEEMEALALGARWVAGRTDPRLGLAASAAFYGRLLGRAPVESSPAFALFVLAGGRGRPPHPPFVEAPRPVHAGNPQEHKSHTLRNLKAPRPVHAGNPQGDDAKPLLHNVLQACFRAGATASGTITRAARRFFRWR